MFMEKSIIHFRSVACWDSISRLHCFFFFQCPGEELRGCWFYGVNLCLDRRGLQSKDSVVVFTKTSHLQTSTKRCNTNCLASPESPTLHWWLQQIRCFDCMYVCDFVHCCLFFFTNWSVILVCAYSFSLNELVWITNCYFSVELVMG